MDIKLVSVWKADKPKGTYVPSHFHKYHEIVYYLVGEGESGVEKEKMLFSPHTYTVIPPGVLHDERHFANGKVLCLVFEADLSFERGLKKDALGKAEGLLEEILTEVQVQRYGYEEMVRALLKELAVYILREERKAASKEKDFGYIINYLSENCHEKISLGECAAYLNLSYDYFGHRFKMLTGMSPKRFLLMKRLEAAARLLHENELACTEIAYRCGFSTSAQFSALFKREYGIPPLVYRKTKEIHI